MKESEVKKRAFAMPLTSPAYPIGPYRFYQREFLIVTYRTDPQKLRELVPEPLMVEGRWSSSSSSACLTRPGSATIPNADRSFR